MQPLAFPWKSTRSGFFFGGLPSLAPFFPWVYQRVFKMVARRLPCVFFLLVWQVFCICPTLTLIFKPPVQGDVKKTRQNSGHEHRKASFLALFIAAFVFFSSPHGPHEKAHGPYKTRTYPRPTKRPHGELHASTNLPGCPRCVW